MGAAGSVPVDDKAVKRRRNKAWVQDYTLRAPLTTRAKERVLCLCEGGARCTREDPALQAGGNALRGLHCNWVADGIYLAMARPWQANLPAAIEELKRAGVGLVLNLQEVGEHAHCGPGVLPHCGYSYDPDSFMAAGIQVVPMGWVDMSVPPLGQMMDIVQVLDEVIWSQGRRVAVHCHAGLGRTGLAIACSLVYSQRMQAAEAVKTVRAGRPGALQTAKQELFVYVFEQFVAHLRCCFPAAAAEHASSPPPAGLVAAASSISGPLTRVQREKLLQLHSPRVARAARRLQADTSPRPTPMPPGSQAFSLPNTGDVASVSAAHGMVQETYRCGLKVTRPLHLGGAGVPVAAAGADGRRATMSAIAAPTPLPPPWDERLAILPKLYSIDYVPVPPRSYADALQRQQRLVHGPERRARRHLHRLLQEVAAAVATAAIKFHPKDEGNPLLQQQEDEISPTQLVRQGSLTPGRPDTFADCVLACVKRDRCVLDELCIRNRGVPAFGCFLADMADESGGPDWAELSACTSQIKAAVSDNIYPAFSAQPLYAVLAVLGDWFRGFRDPALSLSALHHLTLVAERLPPLPEDGDSGGGDGGMMAPELVPLTLQKQQHLGLPASANLAVAALQPLQPVDQELLLALAAMARHVRRASGPAGEAPCVQICRQLALLIIGPPLVEHTPQGRMLHTAASRLLWHLLTDDAAYQCLILMKEVRLDGVSKTLKGMGLVLVPAAEAAGTASASDFSRQQLLRSTSAAAAATTPMTSSLPHLAAGPRAGGTSRTAEWLLQGEGGAGGGGAPAAAVALVERTGRHSQPREATLPGMLPTSPDKMAGQQQGSAAIFGFTPVAAAQFSTPQQRVVHNGRDRIMDVLLD